MLRYSRQCLLSVTTDCIIASRATLIKKCSVYIPACSTAIANCASCILNGENVECQSCNGKYYPATLGQVTGGQCAGNRVNTQCQIVLPQFVRKN